MRKIVYVTTAVVVVVVVAVIIWMFRGSSEDEAPIIVKNGSMTIETSDGAWQQDGGTWSNETGKDHQNDLWVRVDLTNGTTCKGTGHPVHIDYSVPGFQAIFTVAGGSTPRTKVAPKGGLDRETNQRLRHGTAGDGGFIRAVRIGGTVLSCDITQSNLGAISICSSPNVAACQ